MKFKEFNYDNWSSFFQFSSLSSLLILACGGKPYFKQIKYKVGTAEGCDPMKRVYSDTYHEQNTRKSRKRSLHSTNTTKASHAHASMRSSTVQSCSDSAIAFTERQMQDIECLALKLTTQLKSMKAIVEDRIHVEGNKATSYKFNTDEVTKYMSEHNFILLLPYCKCFLPVLNLNSRLISQLHRRI